MFTFPIGWDKVIVRVPLGHQAILRLYHIRATKAINKWMAEGYPKGGLGPIDPIYKLNLEHLGDPDVRPQYHLLSNEMSNATT